MALKLSITFRCSSQPRFIAVVPSITVWGVRGVAPGNNGNIFVADQANYSIWYYSGGSLKVLAGLPGVSGFRDGVGSAARFGSLGPAQVSDDQLILNVQKFGRQVSFRRSSQSAELL